MFKAGFDSVPSKIITKNPKVGNVDWESIFVTTNFRKEKKYLKLILDSIT